MPFEFKLPDLGEGIAEVELRKWLVKEGDRVAEHQTVVEVETDKAVVEVPAPRAGIITRIHLSEGETALVGEVLLTIAEEGGEIPERPRSVGIVGTLPEAEDESFNADVVVKNLDLLATPSVRKLARERGIDLHGVKGSGPRGCITPEDLPGSASVMQLPGKGEAGPVELIPLRGIRRTIARNLLVSQRLTAFVTTMEEVDVTDLCELRIREQHAVEAHGTHLTFLPFFIKAAQNALREHPRLNASLDEESETVIIKKYYNFGIAVETPEGLMAPVIRNVEKKSILELAADIQELGEKARARTITIEEMRGSSFTITNYGHFGASYATPVINWPDVAILGCGRIVERPWVHQGTIAIRKILPLSLTFDHRVADGAEAALFLRKVSDYLEDPALLFIESRC